MAFANLSTAGRSAPAVGAPGALLPLAATGPSLEEECSFDPTGARCLEA